MFHLDNQLLQHHQNAYGISSGGKNICFVVLEAEPTASLVSEKHSSKHSRPLPFSRLCAILTVFSHLLLQGNQVVLPVWVLCISRYEEEAHCFLGILQCLFHYIYYLME